ncbi:MAG: hypothetical protein AAGA10_05020 [Bacteroidota bacterium]
MIHHTWFSEPMLSLRDIQQLFSSLEPYSRKNQYTNLIISFSVYVIAVGGIDEKKGEKRGITIGEKLGEARAKRAQQDPVITQGVIKGFSLEVLADLTGLNLTEVETRMKELGLNNQNP